MQWTKWGRIIAIAACAIFLSTSSYAQAVYGTIFGSVVDNTGAAIPGATITITDTNKGTSVTATANEAGEFTVGSPDPGYVRRQRVKRRVQDLRIERPYRLCRSIDQGRSQDGSRRRHSDCGSERHHRRAAEDRPRRCFDDIHREGSAGSSDRQSQLHEPATSATGRTAAWLDPCGRRKSARQRTDPG